MFKQSHTGSYRPWQFHLHGTHIQRAIKCLTTTAENSFPWKIKSPTLVVMMCSMSEVTTISHWVHNCNFGVLSFVSLISFNNVRPHVYFANMDWLASNTKYSNKDAWALSKEILKYFSCHWHHCPWIKCFSFTYECCYVVHSISWYLPNNVR